MASENQGIPRPSRESIERDPLTKIALRYTISPREYELLHQYLINRTPGLQRTSSPTPNESAPVPKTDDNYNAATTRLSVRVFLASFTGLKLYELVLEKLTRTPAQAKSKPKIWRSPAFRLSVSISTILFFHRLLHRFLTRLRDSLLAPDARPFRRRNPRIAKVLTSKLSPAIGASLAGFFLGVSPADQTRITVAIYTLSRSFEFLYNHLENRGYFKQRPWWFGSWILFPLSCGQLLHAFVFDRDCFPESYGGFILKNSPQYIQQRPKDYPSHLPWPGTFEIVDSLATISKLNWPPFTSPTLFPNKTTTLPVSSLKSISPIVDPAHPMIQKLSCAVLHPKDPSCLRTWIQFYLQSWPRMARFWALVYTALYAGPKWRVFLGSKGPQGESAVMVLNSLAKRILRTSFFLTSSIGTAWGSICLLQRILPRHVLPTQRWFLSGFLAGMWAYLERSRGKNQAMRSQFLYSARMSLDSLWKVGRKHQWWKGFKGGDVFVFVVSLMMFGALFEKDPKAINSGLFRKGMGLLRGDIGWEDKLATNQREVKDEAKKT